jgi:LmbE family N-acetylglucosaminyl deacetylase
MYLFFTDSPNAWVDITDTIETKIAALREHASQLRKPDELEGMLRGWARENGERIGVAAAERFRWLQLD